MCLIFISHAERDGQVARDLGVELEKAGYKVWFYERDSLPGATYISQVAEALHECRVVVVIVSPESLRSNQVTNEIVRAYEGSKHFIPVLYGVSHEEFRSARDDWRQCLGASTSIVVPDEGVAAIVPRIAQGLEHLGIKPGEAPKPAEPKPAPVRVVEPTRPESKPEPAKPEPKRESAGKPTAAPSAWETQQAVPVAPKREVQSVTPTPQASTETPRRTRRKVPRLVVIGAAIGLTAVVLLLLTFVFGVFGEPEDGLAPQEVVQEYFKACNDQRPRDAYNLFSSGYKANHTYDFFSRSVYSASARYDVISSTVASDVAGSPGYTVLRVRHNIMKGSTNYPVSVRIELKKERQGWRIKSIRDTT